MADEGEPPAEAFSGYFSCKETDDGKLSVLHTCGKLADAKKWQLEHQKKPKTKPDQATIKEPQSEQEALTFGSILTQFVRSMKSFYDLVGINQSIRAIFPTVFIETEINSLRKSSFHEFDKIGNYYIYGIPDDKISNINSKVRRLDHLEDGIASLPASILMGLVSRFDANISALVRFLLTSRKERLSKNDRTISVKDVLSANSFDDLISDLVDDEIYTLMRGSHEDQIKYIEDNFDIKIRDGFQNWAQFMEIFERRNLAAHGENVVNSRYVRLCKQHGVDDGNALKLGQKVLLSDQYLRKSTDTLLEFGVLLIWWLWLKNLPNDAENAYTSINETTYDLIVEKRYRLSSKILHSALSRKTDGAPETIKRMMAINLANCYKKLDDSKKFETSLALFDWTAASDAYRVSVASLRVDVEQVCLLMPRVMDEDIVGKNGFRTWPVFD
jgi:hypothetical protein